MSYFDSNHLSIHAASRLLVLCIRMYGECMGAQVIEKQWGVVEDSDRDDKRQVGQRGAGKGHPFSLPDNIYCSTELSFKQEYPDEKDIGKETFRSKGQDHDMIDQQPKLISLLQSQTAN